VTLSSQQNVSTENANALKRNLLKENGRVSNPGSFKQKKSSKKTGSFKSKDDKSIYTSEGQNEFLVLQSDEIDKEVEDNLNSSFGKEARQAYGFGITNKHEKAERMRKS